MKVRRYDKTSDFFPRVRALLEAREAAHNLPLGLLMRSVQDPPPTEQESRHFLALAETAEGDVPLGMIMTPPYNVIVFGAGELLQPAIEAAVSYVLREGVPVPGVIGEKDVALRFARSWQAQTERAFTVQMEQMIYRLDRVNEVPSCPGTFLRAGEEHLDLVTEWMVGFSEITPHPVERPEARERMERRIGEGQLYLWCDGEPVSMAWQARPTKSGVVVSGVYTPPEHRRRGYATCCVAALSQQLLDEGYSYCALYTDLSNPTSNSIYQKIGYRPVCESTMYRFEADRV